MRNWVQVPYPCPGGFPTGRSHLIRSSVRSFREYFRNMDREGVSLRPVRGAITRLQTEDMPAIVLTHNDMKLIGAFLAHYRALGVTRFLCVDDNSTDGTREFMLAQPDVDVFISNVRYRDAHRGRLWRQMLVELYGQNRWYLYVDSDEFLIYPEFETTTIPELIRRLSTRGIWHMPAPMLDMYPPGRVSSAEYNSAGGEMPWRVASLFDAHGYTLSGDERTWVLKGGVRRRCFGSGAHLMKYPLIYWGSITNLNKSVHFPGPYWRNFVPPLGVLLHFKFFSDYRSDFQAVVDNAQHFDGGIYYRNILDRIGDPDELVLESDVSVPFVGPDALVDRGFIQRLAPS